MFNINLQQYVLAEGEVTGVSLWEEANERERERERLSVLRVTRPMYNDVWQRGDSSNAPIRKITCRTNYVENKIKNKLSPFEKIKHSK